AKSPLAPLAELPERLTLEAPVRLVGSIFMDVRLGRYLRPLYHEPGIAITVSANSARVMPNRPGKKCRLVP
ncbi:MAG: hypothetical protein O3B74_11100, partial [Proteobacteria bacterium]|nr:hypothetical protein [Pseudomonadota bacterium]